jgi:uncharacterized membrane protein YheB (UPF0754 family)
MLKFKELFYESENKDGKWITVGSSEDKKGRRIFLKKGEKFDYDKFSKNWDKKKNEKKSKESNIRWYIYKNYGSSKGFEIKEYKKFDKNIIQKDFDKALDDLEEGEDLSFIKDDEKYIGDVILTVIKKNGKLKKEVTKGTKTFYTPYDKKI